MGTNVEAPLPPTYFHGELGDAAPDDELLAWLNERYASEQSLESDVAAILAILGSSSVLQTTDARVDFYLYGTTGSDANDGESAAAPLQTFGALVEKMPKIIGPLTRHVFLHLQETVQAPTADELEALHFVVQPSTDGAPAPVFVVDGGTDVTVVLDDGGGSDIVSDINAPGQIGLTTAAWTDHEHTGKWCKFSTGPLAGQRFVVEGNTPTTLDLLDVGPNVVGDPGAAAEFHLERPTTEITAPALSGREFALLISGRADYHLQNLYFSGGARIGCGLSGAENRTVISHVVHAGGAGETPAVFGREDTQSCEIAINGHLYDVATPAPDARDLGTERLGLSVVSNSDPVLNVQQGGKFSVRYSVIPMMLEVFSDRSRILASLNKQYTARHSRLGGHNGECLGGHTAEDGDVPGVITKFGGYREVGFPATEVYPAIIAENSEISLNKSDLDKSTLGMELINSDAVVREVSGAANANAGVKGRMGSTLRQYRGGGSGVSTLTGGAGIEITLDGTNPLTQWSALSVPVSQPGLEVEDYTPPAFLPPWQG
jgi:hypothetical protein